jgi:2-dehydro-3-deoxyphosphooctonate aldolase (KDO 8-P synthase)
MEVHPNPDEALSDGPNMIAMDNVMGLLATAKDLHEFILESGLEQ